MCTDIKLRFTRRINYSCICTKSKYLCRKCMKALMLADIVFVNVQCPSKASKLWRCFDGDKVRGGYQAYLFSRVNPYRAFNPHYIMSVVVLITYQNTLKVIVFCLQPYILHSPKYWHMLIYGLLSF